MANCKQNRSFSEAQQPATPQSATNRNRSESAAISGSAGVALLPRVDTRILRGSGAVVSATVCRYDRSVEARYLYRSSQDMPRCQALPRGQDTFLTIRALTLARHRETE